MWRFMVQTLRWGRRFYGVDTHRLKVKNLFALREFKENLCARLNIKIHFDLSRDWKREGFSSLRENIVIC